MKLLEFLKLTEARSKIFFANAKSPDGGMMLYSQKRQPPIFAILPLDNQPLVQSQRLAVVQAKVRTGNQINREMIRRGEKDPEWEQAWYGWARGYVDTSLAERYPQVFTVTHIDNAAQLYRYMTTDLGLSREMYERIVGPVPEDMGEEAIRFHGARVFLPTGASKRSIASAMKTLEHVYQNLNAKGVGGLMTGDIRFARLNRGVGGIYSMSTGDMTVSPSLKDNGQMVYSLLHEYGHKYMEEVGRREEIVAKYEDLQMEGEGHMPDINTAAALQDAVAAIKPGVRILYKGRKKQLAKDRDYVVKAVEGGKVWVANTSNPQVARFSIAPMGLIQSPNKFEIQGDIELPLETPKWNNKSDQWFVTPYAETNEQEWWAELFAFYTMGNLSGEPAQWMQSFLGGKATETVGSNEGEVNSDDECPQNPPEHGDEEGNASWDWTDPYHSSGSENAVLSNTP